VISIADLKELNEWIPLQTCIAATFKLAIAQEKKRKMAAFPSNKRAVMGKETEEHDLQERFSRDDRQLKALAALADEPAKVVDGEFATLTVRYNVFV